MKAKSLLMALVVTFTSLTFTSCDDEPYIDFYSLPDNAQAFVNTFFYNDPVYDIHAWGYGSDAYYQVEFRSGCYVYFDAWGVWYEVGAPYDYAIPYGIAPYTIQNFVHIYWPYEDINVIQVTNYGYYVRLTDGSEIDFDPSGYPLN